MEWLDTLWNWRCVGSLAQDQAWRNDLIFSMMKKEKDSVEKMYSSRTAERAISLPARKLHVKDKLHLSKRVN